MKTKNLNRFLLISVFVSALWGCDMLKNAGVKENRNVPPGFLGVQDSSNVAEINWRQYYSDSNLIALIDTALKNNQELKIVLQEIEISRNEVRARRGEYLPSIGLRGGAGAEKPGRYTRDGAVEHNLEIEPGREFPEPLTDYTFGAYATWEVDIWRKLRNAKDAANARYLATVEGKNFMVTNLIAEIAEAYYELMALDNKLDNIEKNIIVQTDALNVARQQKESAKLTQLAVNRFEAQLLNTQNQQFEVKQAIVETENRINFLTGKFPQPVKRSSAMFIDMQLDSIHAGVPSELLLNRPDIRQAEMDLMAANLDIKVARANFFPSFTITAGAGFQAFNPAYIVNPESMIYGLAGELMAPLINRAAIQAAYKNSNAKQLQAVYTYQQTILNAYVDVVNQLSKIQNYRFSFETKSKEVAILTQSVEIANSLFNSARADYSEVLLTQREALESRMELIEIRMQQLNAKVNVYRALGGGWK